MKDLFAQGGSGSAGIKTNKQAIARRFGVKQSEVTYLNTTADLSQFAVIYDRTSQRAFALPDLPAGTKAVSLVNGLLTHSGGSVDLGLLAVAREEGYVLRKTFNTGFTVTAYNDQVSFNGILYRWTGALPKTLPANSSPVVDGIGAGKWKLVHAAGSIGLSQGGTVQDAIVTVHVDSFGADPSGAGDSTDAYNKAVAAYLTLTTSAMENQLVPGCVKVMFGKGRYRLNNAVVYSGFIYEGQGGYATALMPVTEDGWVFTTVGTEPYETGREAKRCFRPVFRNFSVGFGFQRRFDDITFVTNGNGIRLAHCSYALMQDVYFRHLDGHGMSQESVWDSEFDNVKYLYVGNKRDANNIKWALKIGPGNAAEDGSNANRYYSMHIEGCCAGIYIGLRSRQLFFIGGKMEFVRYNSADEFAANTIKGAAGITFTDYELCWNNVIYPMWDITGTTVETDGYTTDHSLGIVFENPSIVDSTALSGDHFKYSSKRGPLLIQGGFAHHIRYLLASCDNVIVEGINLIACGPKLITGNGTGNITLRNVTITQHRMETGLNVITLTGVNNIIQNMYLESTGGAIDNGNTWILTNGSSELTIDGLTFHGRMQNGVSGLSTKYQRLCRNVTVLSDAAVANPVVGSYPNRSVPVQERGASPWGVGQLVTSIANDGVGTFAGVVGGACILKITGRGTTNHAAIILMDSGITNSIKIADLTGKFVLGGSGATGDGNIYIGRSGTDLTVTNRSGIALAMYVETANTL